jgi:6-phosphofructokinase 2
MAPKVIATLTLSPAVDESTSVDHVVPEDKLRCAEPASEPGGGGINVSRAIRKLGGESVAVYLSGGAAGRDLQELLGSEGLDHRPIPISDSIRRNLIVLETSTNRQYRFGMPGPTVAEPEWESCLDVLGALDPKPDYIVASGSLPPGVPSDFYARVAVMSRKLGSRIIVDTSGEPLRMAVDEGVYLVKPNLRELEHLAQQSFVDEDQQEELAMGLVTRGGAEVVVVSVGAGGALVATAEGTERLHAPTVPIKSKVGAGDSMVAGITLSLARGRSIGEAVRFGVAAGSAAVMTPGSQLCRREDAERLYERIATGRKPARRA